MQRTGPHFPPATCGLGYVEVVSLPYGEDKGRVVVKKQKRGGRGPYRSAPSTRTPERLTVNYHVRSVSRTLESPPHWEQPTCPLSSTVLGLHL